MEKIVFDRCKPSPHKLLSNGFEKRDDGYFKTVPLMDGQFLLELLVQGNGEVQTRLIDTASEEEYVLHLVKECGGPFVGAVRTAYDSALEDIKKSCFETNAFSGKLTSAVMDYIRKTYGVYPEFLWESTPDNAVFRRSDNRKWLAAILSVRRNRLSLPGEKVEEIIDLRANSEEIPALIDNKRYFGAYHMNKKHWITAILDGSVSAEELFFRIDESYRFAKK